MTATELFSNLIGSGLNRTIAVSNNDYTPVHNSGHVDVSPLTTESRDEKSCSNCGRAMRYYTVTDGFKLWTEYYCVSCNCAIAV